MLNEDQAQFQANESANAVDALAAALLCAVGAVLLSLGGTGAKEANRGLVGLLGGFTKIQAVNLPKVRRAVARDVEGAQVIGAVQAAEESGTSIANAVERGKQYAAESVPTMQRTADGYVSRMETSAKSLYYQALGRARAQHPYENTRDVMARQVAWLAKQDVTAYTYTRRDGVVVHVPADVGLRRAIANDGRQRQVAQAIDVAGDNPGFVVDVQCSGNPRKSHQAWEGRTYRYRDPSPSNPDFNEIMELPRFQDVVGDQIHDYNCQHQLMVRPYTAKCMIEDPLKGTGYTADECRALKTVQARLENDIRKAKREREVLKRCGLDTREVNIRLRAKQAQVSDLVAAHPKILRRRDWNESIYEAARKKVGALGKVHIDGRQKLRNLAHDEGIKGKSNLPKWVTENNNAKVDSEYINGKTYRSVANRAFGGNLSADQYDAIKRMLHHRDGTLYEDLYAFDMTTGAVIGSVVTAKMPQKVYASSKMKKGIKEAIKEGGEVALLHNHPHSGPPSADDILSLQKSGASYGVIAGHDGTLMTYTIVKDPVEGYNIDDRKLQRAFYRRVEENGEESAFAAIEQLFGVRIVHHA